MVDTSNLGSWNGHWYNPRILTRVSIISWDIEWWNSLGVNFMTKDFGICWDKKWMWANLIAPMRKCGTTQTHVVMFLRSNLAGEVPCSNSSHKTILSFRWSGLRQVKLAANKQTNKQTNKKTNNKHISTCWFQIVIIHIQRGSIFLTFWEYIRGTCRNLNHPPEFWNISTTSSQTSKAPTKTYSNKHLTQIRNATTSKQHAAKLQLLVKIPNRNPTSGTSR